MLVYCTACQRAYNIVGEPAAVQKLLEPWGRSFPCITPLCNGRSVDMTPEELATNNQKVAKIVEIDLHTFYRAVSGLGLGKNKTAAVKDVVEALMSKRVVAVVAEPVGHPERTIISRLVLEDGTRLHLAASSNGACVYYLETRNASESDRASDEPSPDREETGPDFRRYEEGSS